MWRLNQRVYRFGELKADGLVSRTVHAEVPPSIEYEITSKARGLGPTMEALTAWGNGEATKTRTGCLRQYMPFIGVNPCDWTTGSRIYAVRWTS